MKDKLFLSVYQEEQEHLSNFVKSGILQLNEGDDHLNQLQHDKIEAYSKDHEVDTLFLGIINRHEAEPTPWMWEYRPATDHPTLHTFGANFFMLEYFPELVDKLAERDKAPWINSATSLKMINEVLELIWSNGGHTLIWT